MRCFYVTTDNTIEIYLNTTELNIIYGDNIK